MVEGVCIGTCGDPLSAAKLTDSHAASAHEIRGR
jgi:hypothetical protein